MRFTASMIVFSAAAIAGPAMAVDVTNLDRTAQKITVIDAAGERTHLVNAGETVAAICDACAVRIAGTAESRDAIGQQKVTILAGRLRVSGAEPEAPAVNPMGKATFDVARPKTTVQSGAFAIDTIEKKGCADKGATQTVGTRIEAESLNRDCP
jgi:hypothetical protein